MQQRATDQEAGGTGGAGPWPPQAPPSIAAVDPLSGDIPVNIPCTFPIGYPQNDTGQHSECPYMAPMQGFRQGYCHFAGNELLKKQQSDEIPMKIP